MINEKFLKLVEVKRLYLFVFTLICLLVFYQKIQLEFNNFSLTTPSQKVQKVEFPSFMESNESGHYILKGSIVKNELSSTVLRVIADDEVMSLKVNNRYLDLSGIPKHSRQDYRKGFLFDFKPYLKNGDNSVEINYRDGGGLMGVLLTHTEYDPKMSWFFMGLSLLGLWLFYELLRLTKFKVYIKILLFLGVCVRLFYLSVTPFDVRDHDLGDHFGYVEYMSKNWAPPTVDHAVGGAFFHPPLYYYTGAVVHKLTQVFAPHNKVVSYRTQQLLMLTYSMGFLLFGLLLIDLIFSTFHKNHQSKIFERVTQKKLGWFKKNSLGASVGILFTFWPVSIIHSTRIGNDPLLYFTFAAGLYFLHKWHLEEKKSDLIWAVVIASLSVLTKANGAILIAILGVLGLYKAYTKSAWIYYLKMARLPGGILAIAVAITLAPGVILNIQGKRDKLYIDNIDGLSNANLVGNTAANYLWFDTKIFIIEPFTSPYDDRKGRQFFWNYLGKTGLFGEFEYKQSLSRNTAIIVSFLAVFMFVYVFIGLYYLNKRDLEVLAVPILSFLFLWGGVTYMRMTFPANIDFRYITPILISFCIFYGVSITSFERSGRRKLAVLGSIVALLFVMNSTLFIFGLKG